MSVLILYLFLFLSSYFYSLRTMNSCDNIGHIFPMCFVGRQPTFLTWLVFMYTISNFPPSKYYIYTHYRYNMFLVHRVVNGHPQYRSTDTLNFFWRHILQKISCVLRSSVILELDWCIQFTLQDACLSS